ncbi:MAG: DUF2127 domain-containing protein [Candidatus Korobacteraceae bacterium]
MGHSRELQHLLPAFGNVRGADGRNGTTSAMTSSTTMSGHQLARGHAHRAGLRTVAVLEALKGCLALVGAYVLVVMIRRDVDFGDAAEHILFFFHINPGHHWSQQLLHAADKMSNASIAMIWGIALSYAILRFLEGYGLWRQRAWAEWLAIISGCLYLPFELYKLIRHPNAFHWAILGINILVVLYIAWVRWDEIAAARRARLSQPEVRPA